MVSGEENKRTRILLADDHPAVLEDLCALLKSEFEVVAAVGDGNALLRLVDALDPDVIVTDIAMPGLDGIAAAGEILQRRPSARIVFVTVHDEAAMVQKSFDVGAVGYVVKVHAGHELVPAIHAALGGKRYVSAKLSGNRFYTGKAPSK
jgi:DNA-binding NarL/FixJ family response regulator